MLCKEHIAAPSSEKEHLHGERTQPGNNAMFCTGSTCMTKCCSISWIWGRDGPSFKIEPEALGMQLRGEILMSLFLKNQFIPSVSSCPLGPPAAKGAKCFWVWCLHPDRLKGSTEEAPGPHSKRKRRSPLRWCYIKSARRLAQLVF